MSDNINKATDAIKEGRLITQHDTNLNSTLTLLYSIPTNLHPNLTLTLTQTLTLNRTLFMNYS